MTTGKATIAETIAEETAPREVLVTCGACFTDYRVTYEHGVRVAHPHKCSGTRPATSADRLVL